MNRRLGEQQLKSGYFHSRFIGLCEGNYQGIEGSEDYLCRVEPGKYLLHSYELPSLTCLYVSSHSSLVACHPRTNECHFTLQALDEARSIARRPMAQSLKDEREEIVVRCYLAKGDADRAVAETAGHANPGKLVQVRVLRVEVLHVCQRMNGFLHHKCVPCL